MISFLKTGALYILTCSKRLTKQGFSFMQKNRKMIVFYTILLLITLFFVSKAFLATKDPIKVGILHSLTGTMAISEKAVKDATVMAIDEINIVRIIGCFNRSSN